MKCSCGAAMIYREGEDEFSGDELQWYALWECPACNNIIRDHEENFEFPADDLMIYDESGIAIGRVIKSL